MRDKKVHLEVIEHVLAFAQQMGFGIQNLDFSPIRGLEGNIEYLVYMCKNSSGSQEEALDCAAVVEAAHAALVV